MFFIGEYHGTDGPMHVEDSRHHTVLRTAFLLAGRALGFRVGDQNAGEGSQIGFAPFLFNIHDGLRWSPADGYLRYFLQA